MRATLNLQFPGFVRNPGLNRPAQRYAADVVRDYSEFFRALRGGAGLALRQGMLGTRQTASLEYSRLAARALVTCASVADLDTVTINGAAVTGETGSPEADEFDISLATNTLVASDLVRCINASVTAAISEHVRASNRQAAVACASVADGDWVEIASVKLFAGTQATDSGGARIATIQEDLWSKAGSDTDDGTSLVNCIHAHPVLGERFFAVNASGTVTIYERDPEQATAEAPTISSNNGTRLAVTATNGKFAAGAAVLIQAKRPGLAGNINTIATSNGTRLAITQDSSGRLTGGSSTTLSF